MTDSCACEVHPISNFGWLQLRRNHCHFFASYKRRFAVLRGTHLHLFEDVQRKLKKDTINLALATVHFKENSSLKFVVEGPHTSRTYEFRSQSKAEFSNWVKMISIVAYQDYTLPTNTSQVNRQLTSLSKIFVDIPAENEETAQDTGSSPEVSRLRKKCVSWRDDN
eukprot:TRINITY_DN8644_c0_g2_i1.p1 TRINITY_DN8644_c0_g2~~TRINITY_DN8644_c0_g2_i1.p1  ORF type:complete len:166 (-),score=13.81 TRINITY_DN8644_c0_g2_i1:181-678(-)